jgi:hypothetical protein
MEERRKLQRFNLQAQTRIEVELEQGKREVLSMVTKDISSSGTFIVTPHPLPRGVPVQLELLLSPHALKKTMGETGTVKVNVNGKVIRSDDMGMAIEFDGEYTMSAHGGFSG